MNTPQIVFSLAFVLFICGLIGFAAAGFEAKAKSSIIMGSVSSGILILCGIASNSKSHQTSATGHSASLIVCLLLSVVFAWRLFKAFGVEGKEYVAALLGFMLVASSVSSYLLVRTK